MTHFKGAHMLLLIFENQSKTYYIQVK